MYTYIYYFNVYLFIYSLTFKNNYQCCLKKDYLTVGLTCRAYWTAGAIIWVWRQWIGTHWWVVTFNRTAVHFRQA